MSPKTKTLVLLTMVALALGLTVSRGVEALTKMELISAGEYYKLGTVMPSARFGQDLLAIHGYAQSLVGIIVDPEVRQSKLRSPYTNTECAAYVARAYDEKTREYVQEDSAQARFRLFLGSAMVIPPAAVVLDQSYEAREGTKYLLTPIETRQGSVLRREWCLKPDQDYTLAIFQFSSALPPGPDGRATYASSLKFYFTDPLPNAAYTREPCPPHWVRDESTGNCGWPMHTAATPSPSSPTWIGIAIWAVRGAMLAGLAILAVWLIRWRLKRIKK